MNASKGHGDGIGINNVETVVNASDTLTINSGKDTNIIGSQVKGDTVIADIGGDLNIESLQDVNNYKENNSSASIGVSIDLNNNKNSGVTGGVTNQNIDSNYNSVIDQAGIYAGQGGFDIYVGGNTDLKGAVIASEATPDKNKLSTDSLTFSDIENQAEYESSTSGFAINTSKNAEKKDAGITPVYSGSSGSANSTTESAISEGTIEIRGDKDKPGDEKTDLSNLNRNPEATNNPLKTIFDKDKVLEREQAASLFGEIAFNAIAQLAANNKWTSEEKIVAHGIIGGLMAEIAGGKFGDGLTTEAINKLVVLELSKELKLSDVELQWLSAVIGGVIAGDMGEGLR